MKRKSIISLLLLCMGLGMITTSCEDMLTPSSERHSYEVANDTLYSYWGVLKSLQNIAERYVILGECRADLVASTGYVSDTIAAIMNFGQNGTAAKYKDGACKYLKMSDYYHVINTCNAYIASCDTFLRTGTNQKYMIREYAQVQAIRAWTYMQLVNTYGEVPFYTKPMLTTQEIADYRASEYPVANASNLVEYLAPDLINMEFVEKTYGLPQYDSYSSVHSSRVMFPVSVVLGDLYLMEGSAASCAKAAQHYYNFLNDELGGPLLPDDYCEADINDRTPLPNYFVRGDFAYTQTNKVSANSEGITCIPSSTNKLWGTVLTDINRLFGFEATIHVNTYGTGSSDEDKSAVTSSYITLNRQYEQELVASAQYDTLCQKVDYEVYVGDPKDADQAQVMVMPKVGDARQFWNGRTIYTNEMEERDTVFHVMKQNPGRNFTSVYPCIYRKTGVWLRFAEAINRAGYPSYAFAVLKNGLINNDNWYPEEADYNVVTDSLWYAVYQDSLYLPYNIPVGQTFNLDSLIEAGVCKTQAELLAALPDTLTPDDYVATFGALATANYAGDDCAKTCYYIDRQEVRKSVGVDYMNFITRYLKGTAMSIPFIIKEELRDNGSHMYSYPTTTIVDNYITIGVHARGAGRLRYDERNSSYNYVDQVIKKCAERGVTLTKEDIYSGNYTEDVILAVEDLIIDECAMEMAFEGNRFADLARVAHRRGANYLAERVARRSGKLDPAMYQFLLNEKNWYLPFPEDK